MKPIQNVEEFVVISVSHLDFNSNEGTQNLCERLPTLTSFACCDWRWKLKVTLIDVAEMKICVSFIGEQIPVSGNQMLQPWPSGRWLFPSHGAPSSVSIFCVSARSNKQVQVFLNAIGKSHTRTSVLAPLLRGSNHPPPG